MSRVYKWVRNFPTNRYAISFLHDVIISTLRTGPIPQHIAFVMDGNRRYANVNNVQLREGHYAGFETIVEIVELCARLGIKTVTAYAFSIENFKRPKSEVDQLFNLFRSKVMDFFTDGKFAREYGIKVCILGDRSLLDDDIIRRIEEIERQTSMYNTLTFNICCPYTSRDDITHGIKSVAYKVEQGELEVDDINIEILQQQLYTGKCPPLDILVRTSGVTRLSDFMLWESNINCQIDFVNTLWPEFTVWELYKIILRWSYEKSKEYEHLEIRQIKLPPAPRSVSISGATASDSTITDAEMGRVVRTLFEN